MRIKVWGCRGSLTSPGSETVRYGGNTTCFEIRLQDGTLLILDAGSGIHKLGKKLLGEAGITELFLILTHSHWDHVLGFPFFTPAYLDRYSIHVRGGPTGKLSLKKYLEHQMDPPFFPVEFDLLKARFDFDYEDPYEQDIGSAKVIPIALSHPNGAYGFKILEGERSFIFMTDNELGADHRGGLARKDYIRFCEGADLLVHDAQYSDDEYRMTRGWGHSTFRDAVNFGMESGVKRLGITHHDPDHTDPELDNYFEFCSGIVREAASKMDCFFVTEGMEITL